MALPTDHEGRMEIARKVHYKELPTVKGAAMTFGVPEAAIYVILKEWREANGIETEGQKRAKASNAKRVKSRAKNRAAKPNGKANGHAKPTPRQRAVALVPVNNEAKERIQHLEDQLTHSMEEVHTLQKLLMTVGRTL